MHATATHDRAWVRYSWLWLLLLAPLLVFSNGRWQLAIAALATPFLIRLFLFSQPVVRGLLILLPLQIVAYWIMWREVIPAPGMLYYLIAAAYALCYLLPFLIDRIVASRVASFAGTLVLPLCWYLVEILIQLSTPYGTWSSVGYTQMGHGLLTPLAGWVGVAGVAFTTIWIASATSWLVMTVEPPKRRAFVWALFAAGILILAGLSRLPLLHEAQDPRSLKIAAITPTEKGTTALARDVQTTMQTGNLDAAFLARIGKLSSELNEELMARSRDAALSGAKLVIWSETAGHIMDSQESSFIASGQELARQHEIYLFMGLGVWHPHNQPPLENKVIAITPAGEVAWQYQKARPIVGSEAPFLPPGHNKLATLDTPYGRIGLVICHDLDFADFLTQAGRNNVDLVLAPAADWSVIADLHAKMGIMRAVENGVWLLRPAYEGLSVIASPKGDVTHSVYDAELKQRVLFGEIRVMRARTAYPYIRSYLPFVAMALLTGLLVLAWRGDSTTVD